MGDQINSVFAYATCLRSLSRVTWDMNVGDNLLRALEDSVDA
jgi:hypothetical protein